tara:strand:+ start:712 stop:1161 length:450 start_codon:yes stop_codon:yes gene_type:complete
MIRVQAEDFDINEELEKLRFQNYKIGGLASFIGLVRDMPDADRISSMTLEHYPGMTEKQLKEIDDVANARWELEASLIIHRYGRLERGDKIVMVACAAAHRDIAFEACHFLIDWLKTKAPFWKLEESSKGEQWVEAKASDERASDRWKN